MKQSLLALAVLFTTFAFAEQRTSPIGDWTTFDDKTGEAKSIVRVYEENDMLHGRIIYVYGHDQDVVAKNVEGQPKVVGLDIIRDLKKNGTKWAGGTVLDPSNGKTYDCRMWLEDGLLYVRGSLLMLGRTQEWKPAEKIP